MYAKEAKELTLKGYKESDAVKKIFEDIKFAIVHKKMSVHYPTNENGSNYDDWEYLKSLGYEVKWVSRKTYEGYCLCYKTEVLISWGNS